MKPKPENTIRFPEGVTYDELKKIHQLLFLFGRPRSVEVVSLEVSCFLDSLINDHLGDRLGPLLPRHQHLPFALQRTGHATYRGNGVFEVNVQRFLSDWDVINAPPAPEVVEDPVVPPCPPPPPAPPANPLAWLRDRIVECGRFEDEEIKVLNGVIDTADRNGVGKLPAGTPFVVADELIRGGVLLREQSGWTILGGAI